MRDGQELNQSPGGDEEEGYQQSEMSQAGEQIEEDPI
jgi:hypothetical protein